MILPCVERERERVRERERERERKTAEEQLPSHRPTLL